MNIWIILLIIIIVAVGFVVICSVIDNKRLVTRKYVIESDKINTDCRIAFLSDLHDNVIGENNIKLFDAVRSANPDLILIGGDIITANPGCSLDKANKFIEGISALNKTVVYGMGNHEYRMDFYREDYGDLFDQFADDINKAGIRLVKNDKALIDNNNITVQGLMLEREYYKRFSDRAIPDADVIKHCIGDYDDKSFNIMLAHNPEYFDAYSEFADVVLSGHFHGGIMVLPILGGVISARFSLFPKYDGGRFDRKNSRGINSTMIVSRGLGSHTIPVRVFNPVELVVVDIKAIK